jgi:hypothetical protein
MRYIIFIVLAETTAVSSMFRTLGHTDMIASRSAAVVPLEPEPGAVALSNSSGLPPSRISERLCKCLEMRGRQPNSYVNICTYYIDYIHVPTYPMHDVNASTLLREIEF